ncbi:spore protease YyaC [Clostridium sp. FP1]|uniref:spore protease YyaC n=1 Tax=Clostridium sp. FP1 TaxID=2724076 RepID=UPI0013E972A3|nr:spore protease YyaC [Clostridium sp. FP1]MBZ9633154.1 spore protease YyaC [Clostridium sp. FP1]
MKCHLSNIKENSEMKDELITYLNNLITEKISIKKYNSITIACIGTDRCTGDSLGPIVGDLLERKKWGNVNIVGSLEYPLHAKNIEERMGCVPDDSLIIGIDACLGDLKSIGCIRIEDKSLHPGAGVNKDLPPVGDISITGIVNLSGCLGFMTLQNTRLYTVIELAKCIANTLSEVIPFVDLNIETEEFMEEIIL